MYIKREYYLEQIRPFYDSKLVKILVGIRRCGKSVLLEQIMGELKEKGVDDKHIIYVTYEYLDYEELLDYKKLNKYLKERILDKKKYYIFIDEIQRVDDFERVVNSISASTNSSVFITGSNATLMSEEISDILSGRYVKFRIYPLSYREYLKLSGKNGKSEDSFMDFIKWGGLPNRLEFTDENAIKRYLSDVFDSIILKDIVTKLKLTDITLFNQILRYLIDTTGCEFSAENIVKYLKNEGRDVSTRTIYIYLDALCKALIVNKVNRYDVHGKAILKTLSKYYMTDLGIARLKNNNPEVNNAFALETVVQNDLRIKGYEVFSGKTNNGEIDFVVKKDNITKYIQVTFNLNNESTIEREFGAFENIKDNFPKYVLSLDKLDFSRNGIIHKNIIDVLMSDDI